MSETMPTTRMSSRGQVVIPEAIREQLGLEPGARFVVVGQNDMVMFKLTKPMEGHGKPMPRGAKPLPRETIDAIRRWIRRAEVRRDGVNEGTPRRVRLHEAALRGVRP